MEPEGSLPLAQQPQGQIETAQEQKENTQITSSKRKHRKKVTNCTLKTAV
jgi:hypothetical protein